MENLELVFGGGFIDGMNSSLRNNRLTRKSALDKYFLSKDIDFGDSKVNNVAYEKPSPKLITRLKKAAAVKRRNELIISLIWASVFITIFSLVFTFLN